MQERVLPVDTARDCFGWGLCVPGQVYLESNWMRMLGIPQSLIDNYHGRNGWTMSYLGVAFFRGCYSDTSWALALLSSYYANEGDSSGSMEECSSVDYYYHRIISTLLLRSFTSVWKTLDHLALALQGHNSKERLRWGRMVMWLLNGPNW